MWNVIDIDALGIVSALPGWIVVINCIVYFDDKTCPA